MDSFTSLKTRLREILSCSNSLARFCFLACSTFSNMTLFLFSYISRVRMASTITLSLDGLPQLNSTALLSTLVVLKTRNQTQSFCNGVRLRLCDRPVCSPARRPLRETRFISLIVINSRNNCLWPQWHVMPPPHCHFPTFPALRSTSRPLPSVYRFIDISMA
jgi:hypothetical protein